MWALVSNNPEEIITPSSAMFRARGTWVVISLLFRAHKIFPGYRECKTGRQTGEGTYCSSRGGDGNLIRPLQRTGLAAVPPRRDRNGARPLRDRDSSRLRFLPYSSRRARTATAQHEVSWRSGYRRPGLPRRGTQHYP